MIIGDNDTGNVQVVQGVSGTALSSFSYGATIGGVAWDGDNILASYGSPTSPRVTLFVGTTSSVQTTLAITDFLPSNEKMPIAVMDGNLYVGSYIAPYVIKKHDGISTTILNTYGTHTASRNNDFDFMGSSIITYDENNNRVHRYATWGSTATSSLEIVGCYGVTWDGTNLIGGFPGSKRVKKFAGFSTTITENNTAGAAYYQCAWQYSSTSGGTAARIKSAFVPDLVDSIVKISAS